MILPTPNCREPIVWWRSAHVKSTSVRFVRADGMCTWVCLKHQTQCNAIHYCRCYHLATKPVTMVCSHGEPATDGKEEIMPFTSPFGTVADNPQLNSISFRGYIGSHSPATQRTPQVPLLESDESSTGALPAEFFCVPGCCAPYNVLELVAREGCPRPERRKRHRRLTGLPNHATTIIC